MPLQVTVGAEVAVAPLSHRTVRWLTVQSGGSPYSPVNYSGVPLEIPEGSEFGFECHGAPDTVRCARPECLPGCLLLFCLNPFLLFLLAYCEPLTPVELKD
jgi:hypothetical protein